MIKTFTRLFPYFHGLNLTGKPYEITHNNPGFNAGNIVNSKSKGTGNKGTH